MDHPHEELSSVFFLYHDDNKNRVFLLLHNILDNEINKSKVLPVYSLSS